MGRRVVLLSCVLGMALAAPRAIRAETEVDGVGYTGTTAGAWTCGPVGRAKYAGGVLGANYLAPSGSDPRDPRVAIDGAIALESESVKLLRCRDRHDELTDDCSHDEPPPEHSQFGGRLRAGAQIVNVAVEIGGGLYQGWLDIAYCRGLHV